MSYGNVVRAKIVLVAALGPGNDVTAACAIKAWDQASSLIQFGLGTPEQGRAHLSR